MTPEDRELKRKMEEQKRLREEIIRKKEMKRQMEAVQRRKELEKKLAIKGRAAWNVSIENILGSLS